MLPVNWGVYFPWWWNCGRINFIERTGSPIRWWLQLKITQIKSKSTSHINISKKKKTMDAGNFASWKCNILIQVIQGFWPSAYTGFPIQGPRVQIHKLALRSTHPFIFLRSIKWVPWISRNLVVKKSCLLVVAL